MSESSGAGTCRGSIFFSANMKQAIPVYVYLLRRGKAEPIETTTEITYTAGNIPSPPPYLLMRMERYWSGRQP